LKANDHARLQEGLRREQVVLPSLHSLGLDVPSLEATQNDLPEIPFAFSIMPRDAVHSLADAWWSDRAEYRPLFEEAGRWLARLHQTDPSRVTGILPEAEARRHCIAEREKIRTDVAEARLRSDATDELFAAFTEIQDRPRTALIHGDYNASQVMVDGGRISYVVDWDDAQYGRRMRDLGLCRAYAKFYDRALDEARLLSEAYEQVRPLEGDERRESLHWELYTLLRITSAQKLVGATEISEWGVEMISAVRKELATIA
jgi:aminoglycoside phosphotransferase (APT) family kinase protein